MNLLTISQMLEDAGVGVQGETIFVNMMPPEVNKGVFIRGRLTGNKINYELPGYYQTKIYVVIRGTDYSLGNPGEYVDQVVQALTVNNISLDGMYINYMRPKYQPVVFPLSRGNLLEWNVEFDLCYVDQ